MESAGANTCCKSEAPQKAEVLRKTHGNHVELIMSLRFGIHSWCCPCCPALGVCPSAEMGTLSELFFKPGYNAEHGNYFQKSILTYRYFKVVQHYILQPPLTSTKELFFLKFMKGASRWLFLYLPLSLFLFLHPPSPMSKFLKALGGKHGTSSNINLCLKNDLFKVRYVTRGFHCQKWYRGWRETLRSG